MIKYLYYKIYKMILKTPNKDITEFVSAVYFSGLIWMNSIVINGFLAKNKLMPFYSFDGIQLYIYYGILITLVYFYFKSRRLKIIEKYSNESNNKRIFGNLLVCLYMLISFTLIFVIASMKGDL